MKRMAFVAVSLVLLPGLRARADTMMSVGLPDSVLPIVHESPLSEEELAPAAANVVLPEGAGTAALVLSQQTTTGVTAEPSSAILMASGLLGVGGLVWRRKYVLRGVAAAAI